jgi:hypothetical protein
MLVAPSRSGFIEPCVPTRAVKSPAGPGWVHEIKHDRYRLNVRRDGDVVRLLTRRGYDWSGRYPAIVRPRSHCPPSRARRTVRRSSAEATASPFLRTCTGAAGPDSYSAKLRPTHRRRALVHRFQLV